MSRSKQALIFSVSISEDFCVLTKLGQNRVFDSTYPNVP